MNDLCSSSVGEGVTPGGNAVVLVSGGADYADPWHPFTETSAIVAEVLRDDGEVEIADTLDDLAARIDAAGLLVINAGGGIAPHPRDARPADILVGSGGHCSPCTSRRRCCRNTRRGKRASAGGGCAT